MERMTYLEFHNQWHVFGCFNIHQIYAWRPDFNRHNLHNWMKKGYIVRLRKEWYAFSDCRKIPDFSRYVANRIYRPSYISLHTALSYYGIIPESVVQITSVTALKTMSFINSFGEYFYQSVKEELMFGFEPRPMLDGRAILIAKPEKAILDLLYLNPYYISEDDMIELRFDDAFMQDDLDVNLLLEYTASIGSPSLNKRIDTLLKTYDLSKPT